MTESVAHISAKTVNSGNNFILGTVASRIFGKMADPIIRSIMVISMLSCSTHQLSAPGSFTHEL